MATTVLPLAELRSLGQAELQQRLAQSRQELAVLTLKARQGALEQPHQIRQTRRTIARVLTLLSAATASKGRA